MTGIPILDILFKQSTRKQMLVVLQYADVAELADALDLGSSVYDVQVQVLLPAVNECSCKSMESILQLFFYARNLLKYFLK